MRRVLEEYESMREYQSMKRGGTPGKEGGEEGLEGGGGTRVSPRKHKKRRL